MSILKRRLIWYEREVNSSKAQASPRLITCVMMLRSSLFFMQNCQLTETKLGRFDKRASELNISIKISKIYLILAEKLTPFSAQMCSFTLPSSSGTEDGLDMSA